MESVELFELYAGVALGRLYKHFPVPIDVAPDDLIGAVGGGLQVDADHARVAGHTISWLERSGYIERTQTRRSTIFHGTLTAKGFECLVGLPKGLRPMEDEPGKQSLGEKLGELAADGVKEGAKESVKEFVKNVLSVGVGLGIRALSSG